MNKIKILTVLLIASVLFNSNHSYAKKDSAEKKEEVEADAVENCLKAWGKHPFTNHTEYKTLATSVKVFGIGKNPTDTEVTKDPVLVLVNPAVNVMGGTVFELLNPNGWYCFKANVNVMGGLIIKAHCKSHLATASNGATVMGSNDSDKGVTVMGSTKVEFVSCN